MGINFNLQNTSQGCQTDQCLDKLGCPPGTCPDFTIRRHDTKPPFKVSVEDCDGPLDIQGLVVEVNMWALAKLKTALTASDTQIAFADNIGFEQVMAGDIILLNRARAPEYLLVTGFDEDNSLINVQRGYRSTTPGKWKKGTLLRIFRIMNAPALTEIVYEDIQQVDGTVLRDQITDAMVSYEWSPEDTCMPGCYWLEFKLLKMKDLVLFLPGGHWDGPVNEDANGTFWTGTTKTDSSAQLSYDSVNDRYLLPTNAWGGVFHLGSDNSYYTGSSHDDGSVLLNRTDMPSVPSITYDSVDDVTVISVISATIDDVVTVFPSTDPSQTVTSSIKDEFYGCLLGEGVEWVRRLPLNREGFLIKITDSPTREW